MIAEVPTQVVSSQNDRSKAEATPKPEVVTPNRQRIFKEITHIFDITEPKGPFGQFLEIPESTAENQHQRLKSRLNPEGKHFAKAVFQNLETFLSEYHAEPGNSPLTVEEIQGALREILNMNFEGSEADKRALFLITSSVRCRLLRVQRQLAAEQARSDQDTTRTSMPLSESIYVSMKDDRLTTPEQRHTVYDAVRKVVDRYQQRIDHSPIQNFFDLVQLAEPVNIPALFSLIQAETKSLNVVHMEALLVQSRNESWHSSDTLTDIYHRQNTFGFILLEKLIAYARHVPPMLEVYADISQPTFLSHEPTPLVEVAAPENKKKRPKIPRWLRRGLVIGLLGTLDIAAILSAPYAVAVGQAVTGQSAAYAPDLNEDLRAEMLEGAAITNATVPDWLVEAVGDDASGAPGNLETANETENDEAELLVTDQVIEASATPTELATETGAAPLETETEVPELLNPTTTLTPTATLTPSPTFTPTDIATETEAAITVAAETATEETEEAATAAPINTSTATETPTELPATPTPLPTETEATEVAEPISNPVEYFLGGEFDAVKAQLRETRLGFRQLESAPTGFIPVTLDNVNFYVPENLEPRFYYLYSPLTVARSLGAFDVPEADRAAFLESRINDNQLTFLIAGLDYRPEYAGGSAGFIGRSDAPMIVSIDITTGELTVVSIARDTWSPEVAREFGNDRANSEISVMSWVHAGENNQLVATDPALSRYIAENVCGCMIDGVLQFNFQSIAEYIDMLYPQGMTINVPETINDTSFGFYIEAGVQTINGETAVNYMRTRYASAGGDESRQGRQRLVLETVMRGVAREIRSNPLNAPNIISSFMNTTEDAFARFEAQRELVDDNDPTENTNAGMMRSFGITPFQVVEHMNDIMGTITSPEAVGSLVGTFTQGTGQEMIEMYGEGGGINMIQIDANDTNSSAYSSDRNYWQPARQIIGEALGFETIPG